MMDATARLFVGIDMSDEARTALAVFRGGIVERVVGRLTEPELYHITLCFLGQTGRNRIPELRDLLDQMRFAPLTLRFGGFGTFKNGSILWIGIREPCDELYALQSSLSDNLNAARFPVERGAYSPHITLGRQMKRLGKLPEPPSASFEVKHITLFVSTRIDGRLAYVPLHRSGGR